MGYYTRYELEAKEGNSYLIASKMFEECNSSEKFYAFEYALNDFIENLDENSGNNFSLFLESGEETKWYEHEEDMKFLSLQFPEVLFKLHGEGEENGDVWDKYFMNGKMQHCHAIMTIPPFDKSKLE